MLKTITPYFVICGALMHIFCCGLPLLLTITSLSSIVGISSMAIFEIEWFEEVEDYVLVISGVLLTISFIIDRFSKKLNCIENGNCAHEPCDDKKKASSYVMGLALTLYSVNLLTFILN